MIQVCLSRITWRMAPFALLATVRLSIRSAEPSAASTISGM